MWCDPGVDFTFRHLVSNAAFTAFITAICQMHLKKVYIMENLNICVLGCSVTAKREERGKGAWALNAYRSENIFMISDPETPFVSPKVSHKIKLYQNFSPMLAA